MKGYKAMSKEKHASIIKFEKVKNLNTGYSLKGMLAHNNRQEGYENFYPNADPEKRNLNKEIIPLKESNYIEAYKNEIENAIATGKMKYVRKDAIKAIETVAVFNKDEYTEEELTNWTNDTINWMKENFGEDNIKHAVLHLDESSPHLHILVIPMNKEGRLNAHSFLDNAKNSYSNKISSYANEVCSKYDMKRGIERKKAKIKYNSYKTINQYKAATLGKALSNVEDLNPKEEELDELGDIIPTNYLPRIKEVYENKCLENLSKENDLKSKLHNQEEELLRQQEEFLKKYNKKMKKIDSLLGLMKEKVENGELDINEIQKLFKTYDILYRATKNPNYPNKEKQAKLAKDINDIIKWQHDIDKKEANKFIENKKKADEIFNI